MPFPLATPNNSAYHSCIICVWYNFCRKKKITTFIFW